MPSCHLTDMNEIGRKIADKIIELHGSTDFRIAFLPYKRSMWGCMASVYEELKASGVDACCMPIPYVNVGPDGKAEGIDFDKGYEECEDFNNIHVYHPDYVVIHYQYETSNKVTHMLPWFCAEVLKMQGYKIIYIPYGYLCLHDFIMRPGFQFVDYLFLNSEAEKDYFLEEWSKVGIDFSEKCFAYGSPKIDAVLKAKAEPHNGHRTLIVNSLTSVTREGAVRFAKYLMYAKEERDKKHKVIFRPHPLMRQAIRAMIPGLMKPYERTIESLREYGVEIDESADIEKTIAMCDELISDPSSVIGMWEATGKPYKIIE